jgi:hypothetical protein
LRTKVLAAVAALLAGAAAIAQDQAPESLLPPGFNDPVTPAPAPAPAPAPTTQPGASAPAAPAGAPIPAPSASPSPTPSASPSPIDPAEMREYEMPAYARRSLDRVGLASDAALPTDAFGSADGRWLEGLMRRTAAPLPSRWLSIALRRLLVAPVDTPAGVNGADFAAERAWLLLRMGESVSARGVVQSVDLENMTPKLRQLWMQAMLATGDPAGLCPAVPGALAASAEPGWVMAQAMCSGLAGPSGEARQLLTAARRRRVASGIDYQLAEKVVGAGINSRQAVTIEWEPVVQLTSWRWGLATATGVTVPDELYRTVGPQVAGWRALAPAVPLAERAAAGEQAAAMGLLSSAALVDLYGALDGLDEAPSALAAVATDLRAAYVGADRATRHDALRTLWDGGQGDAARYARLILTARAAARIPVAGDYDDPDRLVASMLSAGLDRTALRWRGTVADGSDAWAMLTLADPDGGRLGSNAVSGYRGDARKQRLFFAGLAGLGRLSSSDVERAAESLEVRIGVENAWTRAIDRAAAERQPGTVLLLAAIGMQAPDWRGIPPEALYRIVGALRAVGLAGEARMIAVEAITRAR